MTDRLVACSVTKGGAAPSRGWGSPLTVLMEPAAAGRGSAPRRTRPGLRAAALVVLTVSPIVVASMSLVGQRWLPMSDWATLAYRTSQVGTVQTPLVGPYSFHGFAHPGPLSYWVAAPLYRLTGEDPRSLLWAGGLVNVVAVVALAGVAWRRGRLPLLLGTTALVAVLMHGLGPRVVIDMWNPYTALLPFLLAIFLVWDATLGRRRAVVEAVVPATYAAQAHLAFVPLVLAIVAAGLAWHRWGTRLVPEPGGSDDLGADPSPGAAGRPDPAPDPAPEPGGPAAGAAAARPAWRRWPAAVPRPVYLLLGLLWAAPALDALFDLHNPVGVARSVLRPFDVVGPRRAPALAGDFLSPLGRWVTGTEPIAQGAPPGGLPGGLLLAAGGLAGCLAVARRRRLPDAGALAALASVLVLASVAGAARLIVPTEAYLTEWLKVVGGLVWFTVGWTAWRAAQPALRAGTVGRRVAGAAACLVVLAGAVSTWGDAGDIDLAEEADPAMVESLRVAARRGLDPGVEYRFEVAGRLPAYWVGLMYWLVEDGHDVVTGNGSAGLKWGHDHRWVEGEPYERALVLVSDGGSHQSEEYADCAGDPTMEPIFVHEPLSDDEIAWLEEVNFRRLTDPESITASELRRSDALHRRGPSVALFTGDHLCGLDRLDGQRATGTPGD